MGFIKVDDILPAQGQETYEGTQQQILVYLTQDGTVSTKSYNPRVYTGLLDRSTGALFISNWLNGLAVTWSPADLSKVKNFMMIQPMVFKETTLGGAWTSELAAVGEQVHQARERVTALLSDELFEVWHQWALSFLACHWF